MSNFLESVKISENVPEFTVSDISYVLKQMIEGEFSNVRVRGELGRVTRPTSGHVYFEIKDNKSILSAVVWRANVHKLNIFPEEGIEVVVSGSLTTFSGQSRYQINIENIEASGVGSLMLMLDKRRKKLLQEGLFSDVLKMSLPYLPASIGIITSPTGAVIEDILHRLRDRFPRQVLIWPATMQGEKCAEEVSAAIEGFNKLETSTGFEKPDLLIIARGGGSVEDLWGFNEEIVVRAASASQIPIISAIGHETDITLLDYVADRRAPTPSAAAEMAVPVRSDLIEKVETLNSRMTQQIFQFLDRQKSKTLDLHRAMPKPKSIVYDQVQYLDLIASQFENAFSVFLKEKRISLIKAAADILKPSLIMMEFENRRKNLVNISSRLEFVAQQIIKNSRNKLDELGRLQDTLSYKNTLLRGFVIVRDEEQRLVNSKRQAKDSQALLIEFKDGKLQVTVDRGEIDV
ncbi:MAG: exodeoxyribonuclease VII large subunit [Pseudomonadota bacterium]|nr:exodeoxyribonuclease VII large subunit [Pseudomonadota bacterium]